MGIGYHLASSMIGMHRYKLTSQVLTSYTNWIGNKIQVRKSNIFYDVENKHKLTLKKKLKKKQNTIDTNITLEFLN